MAVADGLIIRSGDSSCNASGDVSDEARALCDGERGWIGFQNHWIARSCRAIRFQVLSLRDQLISRAQVGDDRVVDISLWATAVGMNSTPAAHTRIIKRSKVL